jgi:hypothetical protein
MQRRLGGGAFDLAGIVAAIGPDEFEPIEALADAIKDQGGAIPVLNGGGVSHNAQWQAFGIDQRDFYLVEAIAARRLIRQLTM